MKIVYNILGTFNSGGMERVLVNKANYFAKKGHSVIIITTDQKNRDSFFKLHDAVTTIDLGINYTDDINRNFVIRVFYRFIKRRKHYLQLQKKLKVIKANVVVSMFDYDVPFLYKVMDGSVKILEIHFSKFKRFQYKRTGFWRMVDAYLSKQDEKLVKKYEKFVVLTEEDKGYWGNLENIAVIPNSNSFKPISSASLHSKKVIAIGRLDYQKGFDDLIRAWSLVHKMRQDWTLSIYGQGPLKDKLNKLISDLGLEEVVLLMDPTNKIEDAYYEHSILAMTSRYEGLPMVLLEAQACGLPLVSFACKCGPKDVIKNEKNGFLIDEGDIHAMADALLKLMNDDKLRKEMGAVSLLSSYRFDESYIMEKWNLLFSKLIRGNG